MHKPNFTSCTDFQEKLKEVASHKQLELKFFKSFSNDYSDHQYQSQLLDEFLGFQCHKIEKSLRSKAIAEYGHGSIEKWSYKLHNSLTWVGLNPAQLQTPYTEFVEILEAINLENISNILDLGAGYGRLGLLIGLFYKNIKFDGIELVKQRVNEGNRIYKKLDILNSTLYCENNIESSLDHDLYFIYDFGDKAEMLAVINKLSLLADLNKKFMIIARGSAINKLILKRAPWLIKSKIELSNSCLYYFK